MSGLSGIGRVCASSGVQRILLWFFFQLSGPYRGAWPGPKVHLTMVRFFCLHAMTRSRLLQVSDVEGRRALIQIVPPDPNTFSPGTAGDAGSAGEGESKKGESQDEEEAVCTIPPDLDPYDFVFELHLSEKGADGKYDLVFR